MFSKTDIEKYFPEEKNAALFFLILGIIAVLLSALSFGFDGLAKNRAGVYLNGLRSFISNHLKSP